MSAFDAIADICCRHLTGTIESAVKGEVVTNKRAWVVGILASLGLVTVTAGILGMLAKRL